MQWTPNYFLCGGSKTSLAPVVRYMGVDHTCLADRGFLFFDSEVGITTNLGFMIKHKNGPHSANLKVCVWSSPLQSSNLPWLCVILCVIYTPSSTITHTISGQRPQFHPCRQHIQCCMLHSSVRSALLSSQRVSVRECTAPTLPRPLPFPRAHRTPVDTEKTIGKVERVQTSSRNYHRYRCC